MNLKKIMWLVQSHISSTGRGQDSNLVLKLMIYPGPHAAKKPVLECSLDPPMRSQALWRQPQTVGHLKLHTGSQEWLAPKHLPGSPELACRTASINIRAVSKGRSQQALTSAELHFAFSLFHYFHFFFFIALLFFLIFYFYLSSSYSTFLSSFYLFLLIFILLSLLSFS